MTFVCPQTQALKDFQQGLTHLDANPYTPESPAAQAWVEEMFRLQLTQRPGLAA